MTSVRPYRIHDNRFGSDICTMTVGFGGRPWPSQSKLSHEITTSQIGTSDISTDYHRNIENINFDVFELILFYH